MSDIATVYAVFGSDAEARQIARALVDERLAACANILGGCHSIYRWQGKVEESAEVAAIFKVTADGAEALIRRLGELHSYEVPAAVVWPIVEAPEGYRAWVAENTER